MTAAIFKFQHAGMQCLAAGSVVRYTASRSILASQSLPVV